MERQRPSMGTIGAVVGGAAAALFGLALLFGSMPGDSGAFRWSLRGVDESVIVFMRTDTGRIWFKHGSVDQVVEGRVGVGMDIRIRVEARGAPAPVLLSAAVDGPGDWLDRGRVDWSAQARDGDTIAYRFSPQHEGRYDFAIYPKRGTSVRWTASVVGAGSIDTPAWRVPAWWSLMAGLLLLAVASLGVWSSWKARPRRASIAFLTGAVLLGLAAVAELAQAGRQIAIPAWATMAGVAGLLGARGLLRAESRPLPSLARGRLGWLAIDAGGAFRGRLLAAVWATAAIGIILGFAIRVVVEPGVLGSDLSRSAVFVVFSGVALLTAPVRRVGAAIAGTALLPLGLLTPWWLFSGRFEPIFGIELTFAMIVAFTIGCGLATGWSAPRREGDRDRLRGAGLILGMVAIAGVASLALVQLQHFGTNGRSYGGDGSTIGILFAMFGFAIALAALWLSSVLIGLGTAPWRGRPQLREQAAVPGRQELPRR